ncbi:hypothetical protein [Nocardioides sp. Iso805N]|nr:hypothetical protein [Nocardioides sp. Iso805N]
MRLLPAIGRTLARAVVVAFGAINAISGRADPVLPPPEFPERRREYRP